MDNFDLKKYIAEGKLLKDMKVSEGEPEEYLKSKDKESFDDAFDRIDKSKEVYEKAPKFKIDDFVQPKSRDKYIGQIEDVYINKPENLEIKDGEYVYSVAKLNHRGRNAMSFEFKESDLESIPDPTDYIKSLTPYKRRNENALHENQVMGYSLLINGKFYNNKIYKSESIANGQLTTLLGDVKSELGLEGGRKDTWYFGTKKGDKDLEQRLKDLEQAKVVAVTYK